MILHFLYITCRKNSLFRGPGIEKAGRHTEKAAPGKSAARIAEKQKGKTLGEKPLCLCEVRCKPRGGCRETGWRRARGHVQMLCRGSGADNRAERTASGANTPFFHSKQLRVTLRG